MLLLHLPVVVPWRMDRMDREIDGQNTQNSRPGEPQVRGNRERQKSQDVVLGLVVVVVVV